MNSRMFRSSVVIVLPVLVAGGAILNHTVGAKPNPEQRNLLPKWKHHPTKTSADICTRQSVDRATSDCAEIKRLITLIIPKTPICLEKRV